jgi:phenylalanyl-tRNA synthetase alpha chain
MIPMQEIPGPLSVETIQRFQEEALNEIASATAEQIEALKVRLLGRKGALRTAMTQLGRIEAQERPVVGQALNALRVRLEEALAAKPQGPAPAQQKPAFDFTLPGRPAKRGRLHPITQTVNALRDIFLRMGFEVAFGPEIERDYYNFEALNIPADHPARDNFDTFFLHDDVLMRSQTSTVQVRVMEKRKPPIRIIAPGKVYRPDTVDATHSYLFHQLEGLVVDEGVTMADLKYVLHEFARGLFGPDVRIRFRPSFFPFTEPSVEVDVSCFVCNGSGCSVCKRVGWIEILGAGMVDPNVFRAVGYDAEKYTGFAFGMGIERVAMGWYGINDIRLFLENDLRFLEQF